MGPVFRVVNDLTIFREFIQKVVVQDIFEDDNSVIWRGHVQYTSALSSVCQIFSYILESFEKVVVGDILEDKCPVFREFTENLVGQDIFEGDYSKVYGEKIL